MESTNSQSLNKFQQAKDKNFQAQLNKVYQAFMEKPRTMKEVDICTGVMRENVCRYVNTLLSQKRIAVRRKRKCNVTGYPYVNEYTGDPALFPKTDQLQMF